MITTIRCSTLLSLCLGFPWRLCSRYPLRTRFSSSALHRRRQTILRFFEPVLPSALSALTICTFCCLADLVIHFCILMIILYGHKLNTQRGARAEFCAFVKILYFRHLKGDTPFQMKPRTVCTQIALLCYRVYLGFDVYVQVTWWSLPIILTKGHSWRDR